MKWTVTAVLVALCASVAWAASEWRAPAAARAVANPVDKATGRKLGPALFQENCAICHGKSGKGDGEAAGAMKPRPKSLTDKSVQAQTDGELYWKITEGREGMHGWKRLPEKERWVLVHHLRGLAAKP